MTDLYAVTISPAAMCDLFEVEHDRTGSLPPNYSASPGALVPVVRKDETGERVVELMRWGFSASGGEASVTEIRDIGDPRWPDLVKPEHRCLIPANAFSEGRARNWFARDETRTPLRVRRRMAGRRPRRTSPFCHPGQRCEQACRRRRAPHAGRADRG